MQSALWRAVPKALIEINVLAEFLKGLNNVGHLWVCKMTKLGEKLNYLLLSIRCIFVAIWKQSLPVYAAPQAGTWPAQPEEGELPCFLSARAWMQQQQRL